MLGPSDPHLKIASFFERHRIFWRRFLVFVLFFLDLLLIYSLALRLTLYLNGSLAEARLHQALVYDYLPIAQLHREYLAQPIRIELVSQVVNSNGTTDLVARLSNNNPSLLAEEVSYRFVSNGQVLASSQTFVLPQDSKYVFSFGLDLAAPAPRLEILGTRWRRVDQVLETKARLDDLVISNLDFGNLSESFEVTADLLNNTGRGWWSLGLPVVVRRADLITGVNYATIYALESQAVRPIRLVWPERLAGASQVELGIEVNVFEPGIFMPAEPGRADPSGVE